MPPNGAPPASDPEANTAEALASVNNEASERQTAAREVDADTMERKAEAERDADEKEGEVVPQSDASAGTPSRPAGRRARAADLF